MIKEEELKVNRIKDFILHLKDFLFLPGASVTENDLYKKYSKGWVSDQEGDKEKGQFQYCVWFCYEEGLITYLPEAVEKNVQTVYQYLTGTKTVFPKEDTTMTIRLTPKGNVVLYQKGFSNYIKEIIIEDEKKVALDKINLEKEQLERDLLKSSLELSQNQKDTNRKLNNTSLIALGISAISLFLTFVIAHLSFKYQDIQIKEQQQQIELGLQNVKLMKQQVEIAAGELELHTKEFEGEMSKKLDSIQALIKLHNKLLNKKNNKKKGN